MFFSAASSINADKSVTESINTALKLAPSQGWDTADNRALQNTKRH